MRTRRIRPEVLGRRQPIAPGTMDISREEVNLAGKTGGFRGAPGKEEALTRIFTGQESQPKDANGIFRLVGRFFIDH